MCVFDRNLRLSRKRYEIAGGYRGSLVGSHECPINLVTVDDLVSLATSTHSHERFTFTLH